MKKSSTIPNSPTLDDVARYAKVSSATVSRFINNSAVVSERTKRKIEEAIKALNYVPHAAARALASNKSHMIGVIVPTLEGALFGAFLEKFQSLISTERYTTVVASCGYNAEKEHQQIDEMVSHGVDALVLVGLCRDEATYSLLHRKEIPYIVTWAMSANGDHPCVGFNNQKAAERITDYLIGLGHKKIATISGFLKTNDRAYNRYLGVSNALQRQGLQLPDEYVIEKYFDVQGGQEAFRELMMLPERPTAIICGSDPLAYGAFFEAKAQGFDIPGDISITGFDDTWLCRHLTPGLTTLRTPQPEMAKLAAEYLIARLNGEDVAAPAVLDVDLILRGSCAAPSAE